MSPPKKTPKKSGLARQLAIVFYAIFICVTLVLLSVSLDLIFNPSKKWTDSLPIRWMMERRK